MIAFSAAQDKRASLQVSRVVNRLQARTTAVKGLVISEGAFRRFCPSRAPQWSKSCLGHSDMENEWEELVSRMSIQ